jgi:hypothetical protein
MADGGSPRLRDRNAGQSLGQQDEAHLTWM